MQYENNILKVIHSGVFCIFLFMLPGEGKPDGIPSFIRTAKSEVLATIAGKVITVQDFKERSEFTVRPDIYKSNEITLNNLILEKILALEAEQSKKLNLNSGTVAYLEGIKEQEMRSQLYYREAFEKVHLNPEEIKKAYSLATREYDVEFYRLPNKQFTDRVQNIMKNDPGGSAELFKEIEESLGTQPRHTVKFEDDDDEPIHQALFTSPLDTGTVVGPLHLSDGGTLLVKIKRWTSHPLISGEEQQAHWNKVSDVLRIRKAARQWREYQQGVMKGKRLEFQQQAFEALSAWARDNYFKQKINDSLHLPFVAEGNIPEIARSSTLFVIDRKAWSLDDFRKLVRIHPLVYRTAALDHENFAAQFKLAVIDLIRDYYLTKEAYKKKLEKSEAVRNKVTLWKDSFLSMGIQKRIIDEGLAKGIFHSDDERGRTRYWNAQLDTLQRKYSRLITINFRLLQSISLTKIDMIAMKPGFPFPLEVPQFPLLRASDNLKYAGDPRSRFK